MKNLIFCTALSVAAVTQGVQAQKMDEDRMKRDVEVAENVLSTLFRQESNRAVFFFNNIEGNYFQGYGVIFSVPGNDWHIVMPRGSDYVMSWGGDPNVDMSYSYGQDLGGLHDELEEMKGLNEEEHRALEQDKVRREQESARRVKENARRMEDDATRQAERQMREYTIVGSGKNGTYSVSTDSETDSARQASQARMLEVMKTFLADYGDLLSQIPENEKILVTNRPSGVNVWGPMGRGERSLVSAEVKKADLTQFRQGKVTREQLMARIITVNASSSNESQPYLEMFASIINRLYRSDLSDTYFMDGDVYYERLKDFGVIYYMQVYSSNKSGSDLFRMPTQGNNSMTEAERMQKVTEMYPKFEKELKENILNYGRTIKNLSENEKLIINVRLTKCEKCGIPSTLELSTTGAILRDFSMGKIDEATALSRIAVKKGPAQ